MEMTLRQVTTKFGKYVNIIVKDGPTILEDESIFDQLQSLKVNTEIEILKNRYSYDEMNIRVFK